MKYSLFAFAFFVMLFAYTFGSLHPDSRVVTGPVTFLAIAIMIGCAIAILRPARRRR